MANSEGRKAPLPEPLWGRKAPAWGRNAPEPTPASEREPAPASPEPAWGCKAPAAWGCKAPTLPNAAWDRKAPSSELAHSTLPQADRSETKLPQDPKEREPETAFPWGCIPHPISSVRPRTYITKEWKGKTLHLLQENMFYHFREHCEIMYTRMRAGTCSNLHLILKCISSLDESNLNTILQHRVNEVVTSGTVPETPDDMFTEGLHARLAPQFKWIGLSGSIERPPFGIRFGRVSLRIKGLYYSFKYHRLLIEAVQVIETKPSYPPFTILIAPSANEVSPPSEYEMSSSSDIPPPLPPSVTLTDVMHPPLPPPATLKRAKVSGTDNKPPTKRGHITIDEEEFASE